MGLISSTHLAAQLNEPGGIFVRQADQISPEDRTLISSVARIIISDMDGPLALQIKRSERKERRKLLPLHTTRTYTPSRPSGLTANNKLLNNGLGGYSEKAHEYIIHLTEEMATPAPWVNVLANAGQSSVKAGNRIHGISMLTNSASRPGKTTPFPMSAVKRFTCATRKPDITGRRLPFRVGGQATMYAVMVSDTVYSNTSKTESVPNSGFTWRLKTVSNIPY